MAPTQRLAYIDGLRGLAIALVVIYHAWYHNLGIPNPLTYQPRSIVEWTLRQGYQGVSLFLVLSGFCLAYPIVTRRAAGGPLPFTPSVFFARRILRILPPYYAAVLIFTVVARFAAHVHAPLLTSLGPAPPPVTYLSISPWCRTSYAM